MGGLRREGSSRGGLQQTRCSDSGGARPAARRKPACRCVPAAAKVIFLAPPLVPGSRARPLERRQRAPRRHKGGDARLGNPRSRPNYRSPGARSNLFRARRDPWRAEKAWARPGYRQRADKARGQEEIPHPARSEGRRCPPVGIGLQRPASPNSENLCSPVYSANPAPLLV